jgi:hypothetical protein
MIENSKSDEEYVQTSSSAQSGLEPILRQKRRRLNTWLENTGETSIENALVEDAPVEDAPVENAPVEDEPVENAPVEDAPVEAAPVANASDIINSNSIVGTDTVDHMDEGPTKRSSRKRTKSPSHWQKATRKQCRNSGQEYVSSTGKRIPMKSVQPSICKCRLLCKDHISEDMRQDICRKYWALSEFNRQRDFIRANTVKEETMKKNVKNHASRRKYTIHYFLPSDAGQIQVCKEFFLKTLDIKERTISWTINKSGSSEPKTDKRGKHEPANKTTDEQKEVKKQHIASFPRVLSHYCWSKRNRKYLEKGLSVAHIHRMFVDECKTNGMSPIPTLHMYTLVFMGEFNLGFHI